MPHANLTAKFVSTVACPPGKRKVEYIDSSLEGFFVEVLATGIKTYYQRYIDAHKRQRQIRIGRVGIVPHEEARKRALQIKADVSLGKNPKQGSEDLKEIPTLKEFAQQRYLPFVSQAKRSWASDEIIIRRHLLPALGNLYLDEITPDQIIRMMTNMRSAGFANGTCNRPVIILRYMLKPRTIALNAAAIDLIGRLPSRGKSAWLFPSPRTDKPCQSLYYPWERIRKRAGLHDLRLHDLRHSYASNLVNGGVSLYVVQQLLGHSNPRTTQRYSHLERDTLSQASEIAAQTVLRAIGQC